MYPQTFILRIKSYFTIFCTFVSAESKTFSALFAVFFTFFFTDPPAPIMDVPSMIDPPTAIVAPRYFIKELLFIAIITPPLRLVYTEIEIIFYKYVFL